MTCDLKMSVPGDIVMLYVPCGSEEEAVRLAHTLIEERLVACANIHRTRSLYFWKGEMADEVEHVLICKTTPARALAAETRVRQVHSYEVPCIARLQPASVNYDYAAWVAGEVSSPNPKGETQQVVENQQ